MDAFSTGLSAVLVQKKEDSKEHIILYASRGLLRMEKNYLTTELDSDSPCGIKYRTLAGKKHNDADALSQQHHPQEVSNNKIEIDVSAQKYSDEEFETFMVLEDVADKRKEDINLEEDEELRTHNSQNLLVLQDWIVREDSKSWLKEYTVKEEWWTYNCEPIQKQ
ncbi:1499_t:CDS:2 [Cetraspora pellucida]|uniref:1499_t:CDS:1 n=1 Tax=Cetraspora pellucida TaxID=1433469 RepID=A0ACA9LXP6_9GLOM|nr:1499_t:CDS:2 [Cetraspora pellucida]